MMNPPDQKETAEGKKTNVNHYSTQKTSTPFYLYTTQPPQ